MVDAVLILLLVAVGLLAGAASGLLGIGGGIVMVPALVFLTPLGFREAVAASLLVMVVATPLGILRHRRAGNVLGRHGLVLGAAGFAGVLLATAVDRFLTEADLLRIFSLVLVFSARQLVYGRLPTRRHPATWPVVLFGVAAGFVAKLFGIGGGIVMVPGLVFLGLGMHAAVGTSLVAVWTNAVLSTGINAVGGGDWWILAIPLAVGSLAGIGAGAVGALKSHADGLKRVFALLMLYTALALFAESYA